MYRILAVTLGLLCPIVMILSFPEIRSLSSFWETPAVTLFIIMNITSAYFFYLLPKWKIPAVSLFLVTAFPVTYFESMHNLFAVIFFLSCFWAIAKGNRFNWLAIPYFCGAVIMPLSLFWGEVLCIYIISLYHLLALRKVIIVEKKFQNREKKPT